MVRFYETITKIGSFNNEILELDKLDEIASENYQTKLTNWTSAVLTLFV